MAKLVNARWGRASMAGVEQVVPGNFYILAETRRRLGLVAFAQRCWLSTGMTEPWSGQEPFSAACVTLPPLYQRCPWHGC